MQSEIKKKKMKIIVMFCSYCFVVLGNLLEFIYRSKTHDILRKAVSNSQDTVLFHERMMQMGMVIMWVASILLLFALVKGQGIGTQSMLIRITIAGLSVVLIKLLFFIGFHDFSFTWNSFLMEAIIMYITFLLIGSIIWVFTHFKILKRNINLDE
ncbi:MAG: hypothetical protein KA953_04835 [Lachnospiraceae bacterium]|nr:hypothetical protein [Lachnospiraceae bacterium]